MSQTATQTVKLRDEFGSQTQSITTESASGALPEPTTSRNVYSVVLVKDANAVLDVQKTIEPSIKSIRISLRSLWSGGLASANIKDFLQNQFSGVSTTRVLERKLGLLTNAILELLTSDRANEGEVTPSEFSYTNTLKIVTNALTLARLERPVDYDRIPEATVMTDDVGGIRLVWHRANRELRANFGASPGQRSYLYFETANQHGIEALDGEALSRRLLWLSE